MSTSIIPSKYLGVEILETQTTIERYERLQRFKLVDDPKSHPENIGNLSWLNIAWFTLSGAASVAFASYMSGNWSGCVLWCCKAGETLEYYFFGDWKEKQTHDDGSVDATAWFEKQPAMKWTQDFDLYLGWVAVGRHWDLIDRILQFPQPAIVADNDGPAARAYYLGLACWWRERHDLAGLEEAKKTRGAGSKMYHLLCDIAVGISAKDQTVLQKAFPKYVHHFLKQRDHNEQFPMAATFLWNVAKHDGLFIELPKEIAKFLFEIPQEYWTKHGESS